MSGFSVNDADDVETNDIYDDDSNFLRVQDSIDLNHNHEEAIRFDGDEAAITIHDGQGNFNILSGIDGNNVIRGGSGGVRQEFSDNGWMDIEIYSGSDDTTGSEAASFLFDNGGLDVGGASITSIGGLNGCGGNQFVDGNGNCDTDTDTQLSETTVEQYIFDSDNDEGGMNIGGNLNMNGNTVESVDVFL
jgi:hypothetical protein